MTSLGTHGTQDLKKEQEAPASASDQLAAIAHFFDELEVKTPMKHLQRQTDGNKALLDTINALIAVGAFIAGVQAQIIGLTNGSTDGALERATNYFAFIGLALDLIGTSSGVARALLLQAAIRRGHRLAVRLNGQIDGARHQLRELQQRRADLSDADPHARAFLARAVRAISRVMALLAEDGRFGMQAAERFTEIEAAGEVALEALGSHPRPRPRRWWRWRSRKRATPLFRDMMVWGFLRSNANVEGLGHIPVVSLAGGALCLLTSVVMFAAASQERGIWISCTVIIASMLICSVMPTTNDRKRDQAALYDRVEETLQECPPVTPPMYSATKESDSDA